MAGVTLLKANDAVAWMGGGGCAKGLWQRYGDCWSHTQCPRLMLFTEAQTAGQNGPFTCIFFAAICLAVRAAVEAIGCERFDDDEFQFVSTGGR